MRVAPTASLLSLSLVVSLCVCLSAEGMAKQGTVRNG